MESYIKFAGCDRDTANAIIFRAIEQHIPSPSAEEVDSTLARLLESQKEERESEKSTNTMRLLSLKLDKDINSNHELPQE